VERRIGVLFEETTTEGLSSYEWESGD